MKGDPVCTRKMERENLRERERGGGNVEEDKGGCFY